MAIQYIQLGKPNQNAYVERFNRTFREEVLSQHLFTRLEDVRKAAWLDDRVQRATTTRRTGQSDACRAPSKSRRKFYF